MLNRLEITKQNPFCLHEYFHLSIRTYISDREISSLSKIHDVQLCTKFEHSFVVLYARISFHKKPRITASIESFLELSDFESSDFLISFLNVHDKLHVH